MGRRQNIFQEDIQMQTGTWKDDQHHWSEKCKLKPQWDITSHLSESVQFSSVAQSCLSLFVTHGPQHTRSLCPSPTPGVVIAFLARSKCPLIPWLQSPSAVILEPKKIKTMENCFHCFPISLPEVMGLDVMALGFWMLSLKPAFHSPLSPSSRGFLIPLQLSIMMVMSQAS